jgi:POT family proton-dependent oligopeptide transporter
VILTGSASPSALEHPHGSLAGLVVAIFVMGLGAGSIKANVSPLMAEQYSGKIRKKVLKSGETVIVSSALTYQRIYMYFYAAINLGATAAISASFLARDQGYWVAFLVPTIIFAIIPIVLVLGKKLYVNTPPRGSVLIEVRFPLIFRYDC